MILLLAGCCHHVITIFSFFTNPFLHMFRFWLTAAKPNVVQVISAAEVLKTPAVLNEGAAGVSLSSRDQSSRGKLTSLCPPQILLATALAKCLNENILARGLRG